MDIGKIHYSHLKFQDRRLDSDGTMCSETHPNAVTTMLWDGGSLHEPYAQRQPIGTATLPTSFYMRMNRKTWNENNSIKRTTFIQIQEIDS
ncbi:hypothetical protein TNCV_3271321 [Trichonephila clavipes]|nr:hypothetical protein TNCV_3271321 [Trichonephila clavipes]